MLFVVLKLLFVILFVQRKLMLRQYVVYENSKLYSNQYGSRQIYASRLYIVILLLILLIIHILPVY
jgi:hypothetical protein